MYAGRVVEEGTLDEIFYDPQHPYTWGLLGSLTRIDRPRPHRLPQIRGAPPSLLAPAAGLRLPAALPARVRQVRRAAGAWRPASPTGPATCDRCWLDPAKKRELRQVEGRIGLEDPV